MKHVGIIAEYNPFHNGHAYQLQTVKKLYPDKRILVIMSGDFVQRGEPAVFHKHLRAQCALSCGADLIFELPPVFATSSAEYFATASVLALSATGIIDTLCFGAESDDISAFFQIAKILITEPDDYQQLLKCNLKSGLSFPKARSIAVATYLQNESYEELLRQPNNILGIEYVKAILKYHLDLTPVIIKRTGNGYHDLTITNSFPSATAIREEMKHQAHLNQTANSFQQNPFLSELKSFMPHPAYQLLNTSKNARPLFLSDFYPYLQYALWDKKHSFHNYFEVTDEIANALNSLIQLPSDIEKLIDRLSSKNYTNTRITRALLNILLGNRKIDMIPSKKSNPISYLRLLGFVFDAAPLLKEMKQTCKVPIINKVADAKKILSPEDLPLFEKDLHISELYNQTFFNKYGVSLPSEYQQSIIPFCP